MTFYRTRGDQMTSQDDDERQDARRASDQQPSVAKVLAIVLGFVTLASLIFTAGYNWRGVDALEKNQSEFVRKDVQSEQMQLMRQSIDEMRRQIEDLRGELRRRKE